MTTTIKLSDEQSEEVTLQELKLAIKLNLEEPIYFKYFDEPDWVLIDALKTVMMYYSTPSEKEYFKLLDKKINEVKKNTKKESIK